MEDINVLIDSYELVCQNRSGGIKVRIENYIKNIRNKVHVKKFDKWSDSIIDYDVIHIFKSSAESYSLVKFAKDNNIPLVVSSVVPSTKRFVIWANRMLCKILPVYTDWYMNSFVLKNADAVCAQTNKEKNFIIKNYKISEDKIYVIPNGISLSFDDPDTSLFYRKTGIKDDFILQVGRFDRNKNQLSTIKAVAGTDLHLVLVGGPDKNDQEYYDQCVNEAGDNVHFLGWIDHDDPFLVSAYASAKVVILPSFKEIFGNSLFEGGAFGANLVVSNALPIEEWGLAEYCDLIDPSNVDDIRKKMTISINKSRNIELKNLIREKFTWDKVTDEHIKIYKKIISQKGR